MQYYYATVLVPVSLACSSHPLRTPPDTQDADPFSARKVGSNPPSPTGNSDAAQAKRQQLVRAQVHNSSLLYYGSVLFECAKRQ